jgi:hypothetical protein
MPKYRDFAMDDLAMDNLQWTIWQWIEIARLPAIVGNFGAPRWLRDTRRHGPGLAPRRKRKKQ